MKIICLALLSVALASAPALAQSPLTPSTVTIQRYDEITSAEGDSGIYCCAPHVLESGTGADFYHIRMVFDVAFSETLDRVSVNSSDIELMLPGAAEGLRPIGRYDYLGIFEFGSASIFARRPRDWPNETEQAFIDAVWIIPEGVTTATLTVGEEGQQLQIPLDLNATPGQPISPGQTLQVAVTGFGAEARLAVTDRHNGQDVTGRVVPTAGQALRLDLSVTPLMSTATDAQAGENRFFMYADYFSLVGPDGMPMPFMGYQTGNGLRQRWSISSSWESAPRPSEMTLFYMGTPVAGTYTVYFLQDAVAQFNLQ
jgi:hypothetical protein